MGNCPGGELSWLGVILVENRSGGELSWLGVVLVENHSGGDCPGWESS